jgi:hypothetical protein
MLGIQVRKTCNFSRVLSLVVAVLALAQAYSPVAARPWKPTQQALATDYAAITDQRSSRDLVIVIWLVPPMMSVASEEARGLLDTYAVIGVGHGHMSVGGTMTFDDINDLQASDGGGKALVPLSGDGIPPLAQGMLVGLQGAFQKSFGALGQGFHWFVFEAGAVRSCETGGLSIAYDGETYTYETPIPGCPAK